MLVPYDRMWVGPANSGLRPYYRSFEDATLRTHPLAGWTPSRTVTFTTKAGLDSAVSGLLDGDYVQYTGTGKLSITASGAANAYTFTGPSVATKAVFDFGDLDTGNYVEFSYTGTTQGQTAVWVRHPTRITFIGGSMTAPSNGYGILWAGGTNSTWWDFYIHDVATDGLSCGSPAADGAMSGCTFKGEITNWGLAPAHDSHTNDPGSGIHGVLFADTSSGNTNGNTLMIYAHDGPSGAAIEMGDETSSQQMNNNTVFLKSVNQTFVGVFGDDAGNALQIWGAAVQTGNVVELLQGDTLTGHALYCGALTSSTVGWEIKHARAHNTCTANNISTNTFNTHTNLTYDDKAIV